MATGKINIRAVNLLHEGGTKFYRMLTVVQVGSSNSLLVKRWGKMGYLAKGGEHQSHSYPLSVRAADGSCDDMIRKKLNRGYAVHSDGTSTFSIRNAVAFLSEEGFPEDEVAAILIGVTGESGAALVDGVIAEGGLSKEPEVVLVDRSKVKEWATW